MNNYEKIKLMNIKKMADILLLIKQFQTVPQYFLKIADIMQQKAERTLDRIKQENSKLERTT